MPFLPDHGCVLASAAIRCSIWSCIGAQIRVCKRQPHLSLLPSLLRLTLELCKLFFGCPALAQPAPSSVASGDATLLLSLSSSPTLSSTLSQPGDQLLHLRHLIGSFTGFFPHVHCLRGISLDPTARKVKIVGRPEPTSPSLLTAILRVFSLRPGMFDALPLTWPWFGYLMPSLP